MMPQIHVMIDAEGMAKDKKNIIHVTSDITIGALQGGMTSGLPSIAFMFDLPNGDTVIAETSLKLFLTAAKAFEVRYGGI